MASLPADIAEEITEQILARLNCQDFRYLDRVWTVSEYAKRMRVDRGAVLYWINSGQLKAINVGKGLKIPRWRIRSSDAHEFENSRVRHVERPKRRRKRVKYKYLTDDFINGSGKAATR